MISEIKHLSLQYWLLVLAILINVFQFRLIDAGNGVNYKAIYRKNTSDITAIGMYSQTVRVHWMLWIMLAKVAPDSHIYIPSDSSFYNRSLIARMHAYGNVSGISVVNIDTSQIIENLEVSKYIVSTGKVSHDSAPDFAIAMNGASKYELQETEIGGIKTVAELPINKEPSFLLLEWDGKQNILHKRTDTKTYSSGLLIEVGLLPSELHSRLSK